MRDTSLASSLVEKVNHFLILSCLPNYNTHAFPEDIYAHRHDESVLALPALDRAVTASNNAATTTDESPVFEHGTALINGHDKEVTSLTWTSEGELVTIGDDLMARCWREGDRARQLRTEGEGQGRRWGCGWAEVKDGWDDEG